MDELLAQAAARAITYLRERDGWNVFPDELALRGLQGFVEQLPEEPTEPTEVLRFLDEVGGPGTVATTGGRYFGFVTGSAYPVGVGASWLSSTWDQNAAMGVMSPTAAVIDTVVGSWLVRLFGLPSSTQTTFVSGTSVANATCLAVGRDRLLHDAGWDSVNDGLIGAPPLRVVVSDAAHSSVTKALGFIGLGRDAVVRVPADDQGRMLADALPEPGVPTLVITQAGNVNSGSFDPFDAIADHFADTPSWIHVDGAFGLWAATSPATLTSDGGDGAGRLVGHGHAQMAERHLRLRRGDGPRPADMARTFQIGAPYLPDSGRLEAIHRGPAMSQRARAIETWAVLKSLGRQGIAELIDRTSDLAQHFATELAKAGFTVHNDVVLNQVLVSLGDDDATRQLIDNLGREGTIWAGGSVWEGRAVMRISVSSWATTRDDVARGVEVLVALAEELRSDDD